MHDSRKTCFIIRKNKQLVLLLSTHAPLIIQGVSMICIVPRKDGANYTFIPISLVLLEYIKNL